MIHLDMQKKSFVVENNILRASVDFSHGGKIAEFSNLSNGVVSNRDRELFRLKIYGKELTPGDFDLVSVEEASDNTEELVTMLYENAENVLKVKVHFINDHKETIRVLYQVWDGYKYGVPYECRLRIPLLAEMMYGGEGDTVLCPGCQFRNVDGKKIIMPVKDYMYCSDIRPSMAVLGEDNKTGFAIHFPNLSDLNNELSTQNVNKIMALYETEEDIRSSWLFISPDNTFNDTAELHITGVRRGWPEVFSRYRDYWETSYDFSEYDKEDLKWFNECAVHNFVFFFGNEGFDHNEMKIDVEGLLKQGEEFGGYDTVTIWNQYPRLGIDTRSQWDFYDDFPGGRKALREAVDAFHEKGVPVFLPYIPWDQGPHETTETMGDEFARITKDTDADGWQLDTMYTIPPSFREKLNKVRKGLVLTSQFHPTKKLPIEILTTSWNEFWQLDPMPEVDVLRFLCPIHIAPQIARWLRYEDKTKLINRAKFGGAPIVIWQDVFGRWLPFADDQKAMIKEWKEVYLKYREIFQGLKPIPIYPTTNRNLYCNVFVDDNNTASIYSFYNDSDETIDASCEVWEQTGSEVSVILGGGSAKLDGGNIRVSVPARTVVQVLLH